MIDATLDKPFLQRSRVPVVRKRSCKEFCFIRTSSSFTTYSPEQDLSQSSKAMHQNVPFSERGPDFPKNLIVTTRLTGRYSCLDKETLLRSSKGHKTLSREALMLKTAVPYVSQNLQLWLDAADTRERAERYGALA